jgi:hypothetical protein
MDEAEKRAAVRMLKDAGAAKVATLAGVRFFECPALLITPETHDLLWALHLVEQGHLLWPGGWADQPYWLVQAQDAYKRELRDWHESKKPKAQ